MPLESFDDSSPGRAVVPITVYQDEGEVIHNRLMVARRGGECQFVQRRAHLTTFVPAYGCPLVVGCDGDVDGALEKRFVEDGAGVQMWCVDGSPAGLYGVDQFLCYVNPAEREPTPGYLGAQTYGGEGTFDRLVVGKWIAGAAG